MFQAARIADTAASLNKNLPPGASFGSFVAQTTSIHDRPQGQSIQPGGFLELRVKGCGGSRSPCKALGLRAAAGPGLGEPARQYRILRELHRVSSMFSGDGEALFDVRHRRVLELHMRGSDFHVMPRCAPTSKSLQATSRRSPVFPTF